MSYGATARYRHHYRLMAFKGRYTPAALPPAGPRRRWTRYIATVACGNVARCVSITGAPPRLSSAVLRRGRDTCAPVPYGTDGTGSSPSVTMTVRLPLGPITVTG